MVSFTDSDKVKVGLTKKLDRTLERHRTHAFYRITKVGNNVSVWKEILHYFRKKYVEEDDHCFQSTPETISEMIEIFDSVVISALEKEVEAVQSAKITRLKGKRDFAHRKMEELEREVASLRNDKREISAENRELKRDILVHNNRVDVLGAVIIILLLLATAEFMFLF